MAAIPVFILESSVNILLKTCLIQINYIIAVQHYYLKDITVILTSQVDIRIYSDMIDLFISLLPVKDVCMCDASKHNVIGIYALHDSNSTDEMGIASPETAIPLTILELWALVRSIPDKIWESMFNRTDLHIICHTYGISHHDIYTDILYG